MRSPSSAVMLLLLLLRIAYGSTEEGEEFPSSASTPTAECRSGSREYTPKEKCLRELCSRLVHLCGRETGCNPRIADSLNLAPKFPDTIETAEKRSSIRRNSYLFMKLHPVLNRAVDTNLMKVPTRYRRIGVRLGSEFLGKRSEGEGGGGGGGREAGKARRGRKLQGTELLGKRYGSEMLGKRGVEFLGKRGNEFLGKRGNEFLGKRGNEFLGKRNRDGEDCFVKQLPSQSNLLVQYFKVTDGIDLDKTETEFPGISDSPNRMKAARLHRNPVYFVERLQMS